eukprot:TRINITY_DN16490_c0_g1_i3.p1 TRINITY_DN16490_c0_g1~~TRINITY_DN16490_c0_g1_i3.p1  ORF type:complete len:306 (+),score=44.05 TRINITY_DN16490_c0_g1_i3:467-1384(+)
MPLDGIMRATAAGPAAYDWNAAVPAGLPAYAAPQFLDQAERSRLLGGPPYLPKHLQKALLEQSAASYYEGLGLLGNASVGLSLLMPPSWPPSLHSTMEDLNPLGGESNGRSGSGGDGRRRPPATNSSKYPLRQPYRSIVWADENVARSPETREAKQLEMQACGIKVDVMFKSATVCTRWLYRQKRCINFVPWVVVVTGWREAKPVADAAYALATGDENGMRRDPKRITMNNVIDSYGQIVPHAYGWKPMCISDIVLLTWQTSKRENNVEYCQERVQGICRLHVVNDERQLPAVLHRVMASHCLRC